jgi:hypothetical protein
MGESYIDFGRVRMMVPVFALGLLLGFLYRWMIRHDPRWPLLGMGLATSTIYSASLLEASGTKIFGGLVVTTLAAWLILRAAPRYFPQILALSRG